IFLHQMPKVRGIKNPPSASPSKLNEPCELGDLQTLFLYLDREKKIRQARSVIFQAKPEALKGSYVIKDPEQRELYDDCLGFEYETVLKGETRRLPDGNLRERGLQYIFVDERTLQGDRSVRVRTIPSAKDHGAFESYGEHLLRFLNDSTGLDVPTKSPEPNTSDGWDQIVWDMINHVAKAFSKKTPTRKSEGFQDLLNHFNHFENHETFSIDMTEGKPLHKGEGGFGLQLVIVWDPDLRDENTGVTETPIRKFPQKLLNLAAGYLKINEPDGKKRLELQNRAADEMGQFILHSGLSLCEVANIASQLKNEGLIAGLAAAITEKPGCYDIGPLIALVDIVHLQHVRERVAAAFEAVLRQNIISAERTNMETTLDAYLKNAAGPLADAIRISWDKMKQEREEEIARYCSPKLRKPLRNSGPYIG
ncbi:MAG: hypothetical protein JWM68_4798, partial [Verrucomicrobiales bacterium]|nr:hypothetical protein [Verrucomicrobiales bacterium]